MIVNEVNVTDLRYTIKTNLFNHHVDIKVKLDLDCKEQKNDITHSDQDNSNSLFY